jgi:hypothetical protein
MRQIQTPDQNATSNTPDAQIKSTKGNVLPMIHESHAERTVGAVVFTVTGKDPLTTSEEAAAAFQYSAQMPEVLVALAQNVIW